MPLCVCGCSKQLSGAVLLYLLDIVGYIWLFLTSYFTWIKSRCGYEVLKGSLVFCQGPLIYAV